MKCRPALCVLSITFAWLYSPAPARSYSVLTHEAIIDSVWDGNFRPALLARFPRATSEDLRKARAYAYGGSLIADMGYLPLSSRFFSDLLHYVRSGAIVEQLVRDARTLNEYAFALGTLAHHVADRTGHPIINRITPLVYPKLGAKYGAVVTYEDSHTAHLKTEFGLDVVQLARGAYAPESYRNFIGFEIDEAGLKRAFAATYGIELKDVLPPGFTIGTYRFSVGTLIPRMTKIAWETKRDDIEALLPGIERDRFTYRFSAAEYEQQWGHDYQRPGIWSRVLAFVFRIIPPVGPFSVTRFRVVPPDGERLFRQAFDATVSEYRRGIDDARRNRLTLRNYNLDTGAPTRAGEYELADQAYGELVSRLSEQCFRGVAPGLKANVLAFYADREPASLDEKVLADLSELRKDAATPAAGCDSE